MKAERIYTIGSIVTFFALLPALIYMQIRVLRLLPEYNFLLAVIIIMNVLLLGFMGLEIYLLIRKWKKRKEGEEEKVTEEKTHVEKEWNTEETNKNSGEKSDE